MGLFSFFSKQKVNKEETLSNCSFVIFTDKTQLRLGEDISFTVGICNKRAQDIEIGLMECFVNYDAEQIDYKGFEDKIGGTKVTFPSKRGSFWNARISRLGTGHTIPAESTYVIGTVTMSTADMKNPGDYPVSLIECQICSYEGFNMSIPYQSNELVFSIK